MHCCRVSVLDGSVSGLPDAAVVLAETDPHEQSAYPRVNEIVVDI